MNCSGPISSAVPADSACNDKKTTCDGCAAFSPMRLYENTT